MAKTPNDVVTGWIQSVLMGNSIALSRKKYTVYHGTLGDTEGFVAYHELAHAEPNSVQGNPIRSNKDSPYSTLWILESWVWVGYLSYTNPSNRVDSSEIDVGFVSRSNRATHWKYLDEAVWALMKHATRPIAYGPFLSSVKDPYKNDDNVSLIGARVRSGPRRAEGNLQGGQFSSIQDKFARYVCQMRFDVVTKDSDDS